MALEYYIVSRLVLACFGNSVHVPPAPTTCYLLKFQLTIPFSLFETLGENNGRKQK